MRTIVALVSLACVLAVFVGMLTRNVELIVYSLALHYLSAIIYYVVNHVGDDKNKKNKKGH